MTWATRKKPTRAHWSPVLYGLTMVPGTIWFDYLFCAALKHLTGLGRALTYTYLEMQPLPRLRAELPLIRVQARAKELANAKLERSPCPCALDYGPDVVSSAHNHLKVTWGGASKLVIKFFLTQWKGSEKRLTCAIE